MCSFLNYRLSLKDVRQKLLQCRVSSDTIRKGEWGKGWTCLLPCRRNHFTNKNVAQKDCWMNKWLKVRTRKKNYILIIFQFWLKLLKRLAEMQLGCSPNIHSCTHKLYSLMNLTFQLLAFVNFGLTLWPSGQWDNVYGCSLLPVVNVRFCSNCWWKMRSYLWIWLNWPVLLCWETMNSYSL